MGFDVVTRRRFDEEIDWTVANEAAASVVTRGSEAPGQEPGRFGDVRVAGGGPGLDPGSADPDFPAAVSSAVTCQWGMTADDW